MKKAFLIAAFCCFAFILHGQSGFTRINDPNNPALTASTPGVYKGVAWVDIDNDHDIDLFVSPNLLFRNDGGGVFTQIANPFNFTPMQNPGGASWADLNNDGLIDCLIAQYPSGAYLNGGNGSFFNASLQLPGLNGFPAWGCAIGNWDNDAYPDFIFVHAAGFHPAGPFPCKLYLNKNASLTPANITGYAMTDSTKPYTVPYWSDYDLDGDMDLFIASGPGGAPGPDYCYKNLKMETGLDTLVRMTSELFASQLQDGQCYNFIDFDHDGDLDLCLTNYGGAPTRFYTHTGGTYALASMPFSAISTNLSNAWGDVDNDGDDDVFITNDTQPIRLYLNNGNGTFAAAVTLGADSSSGLTLGDYDNDGDLDFFASGKGPGRLFRNDSAATGNHWVSIALEGVISNCSAIGARVRIKATINGSSYWQLHEVSAQNSFQSQHDLRVHFGLGNATSIDSLEIRYPGTPTVIMTQVAADHFYCHQEGSPSLCLTSVSNAPSNDTPVYQIIPDPADSFIRVSGPSETMQTGWKIFDASGKLMLYGTTRHMKDLRIDVRSFPAGRYFLQLQNKSLRTIGFVKI